MITKGASSIYVLDRRNYSKVRRCAGVRRPTIGILAGSSRSLSSTPDATTCANQLSTTTSMRRSENCRKQSTLTCRRLPTPRKNSTDASTHRSEEHTSELQSRPHLVCRLLLEKKKVNNSKTSWALR